MKSSTLFDITLLVVTAICIGLTFATSIEPLKFTAGVLFGSSLTISIHHFYKDIKRGG